MQNKKKIIFSVFFLFFIAFSITLIIKISHFKIASKKTTDSKEQTEIQQNNEISEETFKPSISIIVIDLGLNKEFFQKALTLPDFISFGFSPYSVSLEEFYDQATINGHESIINIPTETNNYFFQDSGPYSMLGNLNNKAENAKRLDYILSNSNKMQICYTTINDAFTNSIDDLKFLLESLKKHNKKLIYNDAMDIKPYTQVAEDLDFSGDIAELSLLLDKEPNEFDIKNNLSRLENVAFSRGVAIGFIRPYPISIDVINQWLKAVNTTKINIIPISELFKISSTIPKY